MQAHMHNIAVLDRRLFLNYKLKKTGFCVEFCFLLLVDFLIWGFWGGHGWKLSLGPLWNFQGTEVSVLVPSGFMFFVTS